MMKKLTAAFQSISIILFLACSGAAQISQPKDKKLEIFGREDRFAYVDIHKLLAKSKNESGSKPILNSLTSKLKPASFFETFNWNLKECWAGSILREGVIAYCLPYLQLGYHESIESPYKIERFVSATNSGGVNIWYETKTDSYYMWGAGWNYEYAVGPFTGEPISALTKALKPRKEDRRFPGVKLEVVSQGWTFPDMPEPPEPPFCMTNACPQYDVIDKYQSVTTRVRLVNKGKKSIFYLTEDPGTTKPVGFGFSRKKGQAKWDDMFSVLKRSGVGGSYYSAWKALPPGAKIEYELVGRGSPKYEYAYAVVLNDEPVNWDEVKFLSEVPMIYRPLKWSPLVQSQ